MTQTHQQSPQPWIRLSEERTLAGAREFCFRHTFRIGRDPQCEIWIDSDVVSRVHAEIKFENGMWWICDNNSRNGVFVDGRKVSQAPLREGARLELAENGPALRVSLESPAPEAAVSTAATPRREETSVSKVIQHYFQAASGRRVGRHTQLIQQAYAVLRRRERKRYTWLFATLGVLLIIALVFAVGQRAQNRRLEAAAAGIFNEMKALDAQTFDLRRVVEHEEGTELSSLLARIEDQRQRLRKTYEGYIEELGVYRELKSDEERLIYQTARIFNESEFAIKADFVRKAKEKIRYWQTTGRDKYRDAIERADRNGYVRHIVSTLRRHGLPPEFFYLALQESAFVQDGVGPPTRWGRAKGMWQFIPSTAAEYGLNPGARAHTVGPDPTDERQDFQRSTEAAARYLRDLHGELTQASGLLVMAAYNWGEHRVTPRLENLPTPRASFEAAFDDVPKNPNSRNYWRFLEVYEDRIPLQTKDYVLKIFAAAVIGQNPRQFGFDFENPLQPQLQ